MKKKFAIQSPFAPSGDQPQAISQLVEGLNNGLMYQTLLGVTGSGKTFAVANMIQSVQRPALVLAPNKTLAAQFYSEIREFFPNNAVEYFVSYYDYYQPEVYLPTSDIYIEKDSSVNAHIEQMRLSATKSLLERRDIIIVATVSAIYGLGDPKSYKSMILTLRKGDSIDYSTFLHRLAEIQYQRNDIELQRAGYRVRGDVIDVFPADSERDALRIEFFGDEVEQITVFDPLTNQVSRKLSHVSIFPKTHYVTSRDNILKISNMIKKDLQIRLKELESNHQIVEAKRLEQRTKFDIEMMLELGYCSGIENYSRYLSGRKPGDPPPTLMDYLPNDALLIIDESHVTIPQLRGMYRGDRTRKENLVKYGFRLPVALDNRPLRFDEFKRLSPQTVFVSATPGLYETDQQDQVIELLVRPTGLLDPEVEVRPLSTQVDDLLSEIALHVAKDERVLVTTLTKLMAENLTEYLAKHDIRVRYLHSDIETVERVEILRDLRLGVFDVLVGINLLREGLDLPEVSLVAILDADKEGFLRSERSLIQTIGRAARHLNGKAILYADKITPSIDYALTETNRRRHIQKNYNQKHGIKPAGIKKSINDILEVSRDKKVSNKNFHFTQKVLKDSEDYSGLTEKRKIQKIKEMERCMLKHAKDLEFEEASKLRDKILCLKKSFLI